MSEKRRYLRVLLLGIVCCVNVTLAARPVPSADVECEVLCSNNVQPYCNAEEHLVWNESDGAEWFNAMRRDGAHPYWCYAGTCANEHDMGLCQIVYVNGETLMTPETVVAVKQAVTDADATGVAAFLKAHPSQLLFNIKRSAIQFVACNGSVKEHIQLPSEMARQLSSVGD